MMYPTGPKNIRGVIPFPRTPGNTDFSNHVRKPYRPRLRRVVRVDGGLTGKLPIVQQLPSTKEKSSRAMAHERNSLGQFSLHCNRKLRIVD